MLPRKLPRQLVGIIILCLTPILVLSGCTPTKNNNGHQKLSIVTTTDFYGEVAKAVVGNKGSVRSIINKPAMDPHDYEPTTQTAKEVSKADFVIANGIGYDPWINKLANNTEHAQFIKIGSDVLHRQTGDNPHIWYEPTTMAKYATYLAKQLGKKQPQNKQYFAKNAKAYIQSLAPMQHEFDSLARQAKTAQNKNVFVSEPIFDYAINAMGYHVANQRFENAVEKGTDPSVQTINQMQQRLRHHKIAFFVYNKQVDSQTVNNLVTLAKKKHVPVLKVTETLPAHQNYEQWMTSQYKELNQILNQK